MPLFEVYAHPELRRYKAPIFSAAVIYQIIFTLIIIVIPFIIAYRSFGFWSKVAVDSEYPQVSFRYEALVILESRDSDVSASSNAPLAGKLIGWSTYPNWNQIMQPFLRVPVIEAFEVDLNADGINDYLNITISFPLMDTENVYSVKFFLIFDYTTFIMRYLAMRGLAYNAYNSFTAGSGYSVIGDLEFRQREYVPIGGLDTRYATSIINDSSIYPADFDLGTILRNYDQRNFSTTYNARYPIWVAGRAPGQPFQINAIVNYVSANIYYRPNFWMNIKFAWIQYLSILVIIAWLLGRLKQFMFEYQLVPTVVKRPFVSEREASHAAPSLLPPTYDHK